MVQDIVLNKMASIRRCESRIREVYADTPSSLEDITKQDSIVLNIQRACEAAIDLAMHICSVRKLGVPQFSREAFDLLHREGVIDDSLLRELKAMVGFRNIAIHEYQKIQIEIVRGIIENNLSVFDRFAQRIAHDLD